MVPTHDEMRKAAMMPGRAHEFGEWWKAYALRLEQELDAAQLRSIEARNPGIDMDEIRRTRSQG
jgi:hypothetical protein